MIRSFAIYLIVQSTYMTLAKRTLRVAVTSKPSFKTFDHSVQNTLKLPVWPVYGGVIAQLSDWFGGKGWLTDKLMDTLGGRVVPMTFSNLDTSPFLLLVHHCHTFIPLDPFRVISKFFIPEGFPAHPHSGFSTVTYCIDGGLRHRDSEGMKMSYGDGDVQWMRAGRGTIHEEMWDVNNDKFEFKKIEIFQLWVNLPEKSKTLKPQVTRLHNQDIPIYRSIHGGHSIKVIAGELYHDDLISSSSHKNQQIDTINTYGDKDIQKDIKTEQSIYSINTSPYSSSSSSSSQSSLSPKSLSSSDPVICGPGNTCTSSPLNILHINIQPNKPLHLNIPSVDTSVVVYIRRGTLLLQNTTAVDMTYTDEVVSNTFITYHNNNNNNNNNKGNTNDSDTKTDIINTLTLQAGSRGCDCLLLIGQKIKEPVLWEGPLVQTNEQTWSESMNSFKIMTELDGFWHYTLSDTEWYKKIQNINLQNIIKKVRMNLNDQDG